LLACISEFGKPEGLVILSNSSYIDSYGWMHVVGTKNISAYTTTYVKVIATFYDNTGRVVHCDFTFSNPDDLETNQAGSFDILLISERVSLIESYELTAESHEYAIIPEFPSSLVLPLLVFLILIVVVLSKKKDTCDKR